MSRFVSVIPVVLGILLGAVAVAQPRVTGVRERKARQLTLRVEEPPVPHPLHVAAAEVTTLTFDAPIEPESVDRAALAPYFSRVAVHEDVVVLKASMDVPAGKEPVLTVRFAGAGAPERVTFVLSTVEAEVDSQVEVFRQGRSAQDLGKELADLRARCAVTEAGIATLRARCALSGLGGAVLSGAITRKGVAVVYLPNPSESMGLRAGGPHALYRSGTARALATRLFNPPGSDPWVPGLARVIAQTADGRARVLQEPPLLMHEQRLEAGAQAFVVVEWQPPLETPPGTHLTLELWDREGKRGVRWEQVSP
ncbi:MULTISPECIES: DUF2381 family protein [Corallococcus]|uniref:DUF2381 family protein n=1 Tax=Corallococcus TaxID=83461 RepID=UPI0011800D1F|nr:MULTISPECIES: DUF2381 family protein [Corallococcus]NBD12612.1 DUF2381 family protein [Corallococcus silvisoli]TSC29547.1 DUF2381 family protein [Corallococcus sp. Z5C101001]